MVVRSIRDHVATHNWFAVTVDVFIVVLGVFLGTQVNNWNERRIEARQARDYRARLIDEVEFNRRQYATQQAYYRQAQDYGKQALAALKGGSELSDRDFLIAGYQLSQTDTTAAKSQIYDEMVANGLVVRLGGDRLQLMASDYYLGLATSNRINAEIYPYRSLIREVMPYAIQKAIRDECGDRDATYQGRIVGVRLVVPCRLAIDSAVAASAVRAIRSTPRMADEMTRYVASLDEKLDQFKAGVRVSGELRDALKVVGSGNSP